MADDFNPYHVWLAIPPDEQPANYYRLLGVRQFETNGDVIDGAADRQMAHLRTFQGGKHGDLTQRLLNELAAARVSLLDPKKRAEYDQQLRAKLAAAAPAAEPGAQTAAQPAKPPLPLRRPAAAAASAAAAQATAEKWDDLLGETGARTPQKSGIQSAKSLETAAKQDAKKRQSSIYIAAAVALLVAAGIGFFVLNRKTDGTLVLDWPASDLTDVAISVDGAPVEIPSSGAWEHNFPAGPHHFVAQRPAFKMTADITLGAGERMSISPDWKPKATLTLNWPPTERAGADLKIDGRPQILSQSGSLEFPVEPGKHLVQITRPNAAPFVATPVVVEDQPAIVVVLSRPSEDARLAFDWPTAQRAGATMTIDGQTISGFGVEPYEMKLKPGRHAVRINRPGFLPFNQTVELVSGVNPPLRPIWRPAPTVAIDPKVTPPNVTTPNVTTPNVVETTVPAETTTPVETTTPQPAKKLPAPLAADQERIAKQLDELYKISRPGSKDAAKAQELYDVAAKAGASPVERYMLLLKGAEIAAVAGDLSLSMQGIDALDGDYEINAIEIKQKLLDKFVTASKPDQLVIAIPTAEQLVDQAIAADQYAIALTMLTTASRAATKSQIATRKEIEERLSHRHRDIRVLEPIHAAAKKAQETLDKNPADPEASTIVGRWRCLFKSDWTAGLPLLAKGSDEKFKALAVEDIKGPTEPAQQVQLADGWWDLSQKEASFARDSLRLHAGDLYQLALPNLTSALKKASIEKRMAEIANLPRPAAATAPKPAIAIDPFPTTKSPFASSAAPVHFTLGQWVDVLQMVDIPRDRIAGNWKRDDTDLNCDAGDANRLELPVVVNGGYDLEVEFTRTKGNADVVTLLSIGGHSCMVTLNGFSGLAGGLMYLDGHDANNPANPIIVRPSILENDHRYRILVSVRIRPNGRASLDFSLDGKPYLPHWEGDPSQLSDYWAWELANPNGLGFGAAKSEVSFHSARLRMVSGQATSVAAAAKSNAQRTVSSDKSAGPVAFPRGVWVDVLRLVDTSRDRVEGIWTWSGNELSCKSVPFSRIGIPVSIDGGYDLEVEFTRTIGWGDIATIVSAGSHQCTAVLSAWGGQVSGLAVVDNHDINDPDNTITVRPGKIEDKHRYRLLVSVRVLANDQASIDVSLDGQPYLPRWKGDPATLSLRNWWSVPNPRQPGLCTYGCKVTFHSARLRVVTGKATLAEPVTAGR